LLGGPQNTIKSHLVFTALFCFAPFSVFFSRMSAPYYVGLLQSVQPLPSTQTSSESDYVDYALFQPYRNLLLTTPLASHAETNFIDHIHIQLY
jgi:hypothetical protein